MRVVFTFILFLIASNTIAQNKSDLYLRADSIIKYELKFKSDSAYQWHIGETNTSITLRDNNKLPSYPLIIVNRKAVSIDKLNNAILADVKEIDVLTREVAVSLYGFSGL